MPLHEALTFWGLAGLPYLGKGLPQLRHLSIDQLLARCVRSAPAP